jgi:putative glutamate/gamma-aminobutyrate antiporter
VFALGCGIRKNFEGAAKSMSESTKTPAAKKAVVIGLVAFSIMNFTTIVSLRGLPSQAEYGLQSIFYFVFAAIVFLVPTALVAAELASAFPHQGGVFRWVSEAFGPKWGFAAMYYQWQANVIWIPMGLTFGASCLAYVWWPESGDAAIAGNKFFALGFIVVGYVLVTTFSLFGTAASSRLSTLGGLFGTIIPGGILILLGIAYVAMGNPIQMPVNTGFIPDFSNFHSMVLAAGIFLYYTGMEMQAQYIKNLPNPRRNYPLSILLSGILTLAVFILGTLAVGVVIPQKSINVAYSLLVAYHNLWAAMGVPWLGNVMAAMLVLGVLGQASVIQSGTSTGLFCVGKAGYLPTLLQKSNSYGAPVGVLVMHACLVTVLCVAFAILPSVESTFQILAQMDAIMYLLMYLVLFPAAIRLRYSQPDTPRAFKVPGGNITMWIIGIVGFGGTLSAVALSLTPPNQFSTGSALIYTGIIAGGCAAFTAFPFILQMFRKPSWKIPGSDFEPFQYEIMALAPASSKMPLPLVVTLPARE